MPNIYFLEDHDTLNGNEYIRVASGSDHFDYLEGYWAPISHVFGAIWLGASIAKVRSSFPGCNFEIVRGDIAFENIKYCGCSGAFDWLGQIFQK
jgi:hypothetical protein